LAVDRTSKAVEFRVFQRFTVYLQERLQIKDGSSRQNLCELFKARLHCQHQPLRASSSKYDTFFTSEFLCIAVVDKAALFCRENGPENGSRGRGGTQNSGIKPDGQMDIPGDLIF
jgi:hypothetical protein